MTSIPDHSSRRPGRFRSQRARIAALLAATAPLIGAALGADVASAVTKMRVGGSEHGAFSRIVLDLRTPDGWRSRPLDRGIEIELPISDLVLHEDAAEVFRRTQRVAELSSSSAPDLSFVVIRFNCDCEGRAYAEGNRSIVIDISPRRADAATRPPLAPSEEAVAPAGAPDFSGARNASVLPVAELGHQNRGIGLPADAIPSLPARAPDDDRAAPDASNLGPADLDAAGLDSADLNTADIATSQVAADASASPEEDLVRARDLLMQKLLQAADEGLIELRDGPGPARPTAPTEPTDAAALAAAEAAAAAANAAAAPAAPPPAAPDGRAAETAPSPFEPAPDRRAEPPTLLEALSEQARAQLPPTTAPNASSGSADVLADAVADAIQGARTAQNAATPTVPPAEAACLTDDALDPEPWLTSEPFSEALAARRAVLYDALNRVQPDAVSELMRFYIGVGFYPEAASMPATYDVDTEDTRLLADLARILDGRAPSAEGPFGAESQCRGRHALWRAAALAEAEPARAAAAYRRSGRALSRIPTTLRRSLGARIGLAAAAAGDWDTARDIYRLLRRTVDAPGATLRLLRAELALVDGRGALARRELAQVATSRDARAPQAQIRLSQILEPPAETAEAEALIDTLTDAAMQYRGSPLEPQLIAASARLAVRFGLLGRALEDLDATLSRTDGLPPSDALRLTNLRLDLIGAEIAALRVLDSDPVAASTGLVKEDAAPGTKTISPRLRVSAGAIQTVEAVRNLPADPEADALRLALAEHLLRMRASSLAALVVDASAAERSVDAAVLRARALHPLGGGAPGAGRAAPLAQQASAPVTTPEAADATAGESPAQARRVRRIEQLSAPAPRLGEASPDAPYIPPPVNDPSRGPGSPITRGEEILRSLEQDMKLLQEVVVDG